MNKTIFYYLTTTFELIFMSQEPTEQEICTAIEKLTITNDLEKNGEHREKRGKTLKHLLLYLSKRFYVPFTV